MKREINHTRVLHLTLKKRDFIESIKIAIDNGTGYAAGKFGNNDEYFIYYQILLDKKKSQKTISAFEKDLPYKFQYQEGLFPVTRNFILDYSKFYVEQTRKLDFLGVCYDLRELEVLKYYHLNNKFIFYTDQEPDRSVPDNPQNCYLQYFKDKKILIICSFADILKERATKEIFEGVWAKTGKKWFYPASVDALEFPYGFSKETQKRYSTVFDLIDSIKNEINQRDFDVALIGAAGLAIPLAAYIKDQGRIAISLAGHLQAVFGVIGKRWWNREDWKRDYFNSYWINNPEKYKPKELMEGIPVCDNGDYW